MNEEDEPGEAKLGSHHTARQWANKLRKRGWTHSQIGEAISGGVAYPAMNAIYPENGATRYVHPTTGRSVVVDDLTGVVIHVGGDGFLYE